MYLILVPVHSSHTLAASVERSSVIGQLTSADCVYDYSTRHVLTRSDQPNSYLTTDRNVIDGEICHKVEMVDRALKDMIYFVDFNRLELW